MQDLLPHQLTMAELGTLMTHYAWVISIVLSVFSVVVLMVLVVRRACGQRRYHKTENRRRELNTLMITTLHKDAYQDASFAHVPKLSAQDKPLVCDIAIETLRHIKGQDVQTLSALLQHWQLRPYILKRLQKGGRGEKVLMLTLLAIMPYKNNVSVLYDYAAYDDVYVQLAALRALLSRDDAQKHLNHMLTVLAQTEQTNVVMLADILKKLRTPEGVRTLVRLSKRKKAADGVRFAALMALKIIGDASVATDIKVLLKSKRSYVRAGTINVLGKLKDRTYAPVIEPLLKDKKVRVRQQAAKALGAMANPASLKALTMALEDKDWWVQFYAAKGLWALGSTGKSLLKSYQSQPESVAWQVYLEMQSEA